MFRGILEYLRETQGVSNGSRDFQGGFRRVLKLLMCVLEQFREFQGDSGYLLGFLGTLEGLVRVLRFLVDLGAFHGFSSDFKGLQGIWGGICVLVKDYQVSGFFYGHFSLAPLWGRFRGSQDVSRGSKGLQRGFEVF